MSERPLIAYGISEVAGWLGVSRAAITNYIVRHDAPVPDVVILTPEVEFKGWLPERRAEWQAFYNKLHPDGPRKAREPAGPHYRPEEKS